MFNSIQDQQSFDNQLNTANPVGGADFSALQTQGMPLGNQQAGVGQTQQLNKTCADPWSNQSVDQLISQAGSSASTQSVAAGADFAGSTLDGATVTNSAGDVLIQGGDTSDAEKSEVNDLLGQGRFNRDWNSHGKKTFVNRCTNIVGSAYENPGFGVTDSMSQAFNLGTVVYRQSKQVNGTIGYEMEGSRDKNDYFKFRVGKSGRYNLRLSGLTGDSGLALYKQDGTLLGFSDKEGNLTEQISKGLKRGNYYARVYNYDESPWEHSDNTNYKLNIWKSGNNLERSLRSLIKDKSVENAALNAVKYDNRISRNDVIGVLKSAGDFGSVSGQEVGDLRRFWNRTDHLMRSDVKVLSQKVAFHDDSNEWYTGSDSVRDELGDLKAGTSRQDLNLLIGKHMLGTDRPAIHRTGSGALAGSYTTAAGTLTDGTVSADDVGQGSVGTCYFLAGLAGTANDKPDAITNMFTDNGDGTWSVRFFTNGKTDYVTVDRQMATSGGRYLYANDGGDGGTRNIVANSNELWVSLAEKAYAQVNESGRIGQDGNNYYGSGNTGIGWGSASAAINHITGLGSSGQSVNATGIGGLNEAELITMVNSNQAVTVSGFNTNATNSNAGSTSISTAVQGHVYSVVGYNATTKRFDIRNPWDSRHLSLTHAQLRQLGAYISYSNT